MYRLWFTTRNPEGSGSSQFVDIKATNNEEALKKAEEEKKRLRREWGKSLFRVDFEPLTIIPE